jgi:hypothetical protein
MALLFMCGFDAYGPANSNSTTVAALLTAGEWTTNAVAVTIVAPLSSAGYALSFATSNASLQLTKTLAASYGRLIGGFRFSSNVAGFFGISFTDGGSAQASIVVNSGGTISVRNGIFNSGTVLATSTASITANTTHYLEWDITFANTGSFTVWLDGVAVIGGSSGVAGTGDTTTTANSTANGIGFANSNTATGIIDDLYLFDNTGSTNNAPLLTSPRIETQFPTGDGAVQFAVGAAILGSSISRSAGVISSSANQFRVRPVTPAINCTLQSVSFLPNATNASVQVRPVIYSDSAGLPNTLMSAGSVVVGTTAGAAKTMPLTTPQALTAGTQYWIGYMCDISVTSWLSQLDAGSTDRTATSTFASGAPGTASGTSAAVSTVIWGNIITAAGNYYSANQNPAQGAQSYVFEATVGEEDLYTYPALSAPPSAIYAVAVKASVAKSDAGAKTVSVRCKSGSTDSGGAAAAPGTSYGWTTAIFERDPNGSVAWTLSALNAAQAGVKVES